MVVVHHHRNPRKPNDHGCSCKRPIIMPTRLHFLFLFSFTLASLLFLMCSSRGTSEQNTTISCSRTAFRTDICSMKGDIRTHSNSSTVFIHLPKLASNNSDLEERIRPYPRKWETSIMSTVQELRLKPSTAHQQLPCDVVHNAPAVVFATGGYTGNVFHEFNEGIIPLYITSQHFDRNVVFVILHFKNWWITKYGDVLSRLSSSRPVDFLNDARTHCFRDAIVGLNIHDDLSIDPPQMVGHKSILDFRQLLDDAYRPRIRSLEVEENATDISIKHPKPKLVILFRNGSRVIENELELVELAEEIGFRVEILRPDRTTELAIIYRVLNSSEAMIGVHGAAMTHFLFMRPGSVFIQIVPLGTDWAAETYYGEPAVKLGLWYLGYKILPTESSLYREYEKDDPVIKNPKGVNAKGWEATKKIYLDVQNVRLDLKRFRRQLERSYWYLISRRRSTL